MTDFNITTVFDGLDRIELPGWSDVGSGTRPTNVYVVGGERPALIGAGHPSNGRDLVAALAELDIPANRIERIVIGSWAPQVLGGCTGFPRADRFVTSTDMIRPRAWDDYCREQRARFLGIADEVFERTDDWTRADLEAWLGLAFPEVSSRLDFIPIRSGQSVRVGPLRLEVVAAPGPNPGHSILWEAEQGLLFCGDLEPGGLPGPIDSTRDYLVALERAAELDAKWLIPTHGEPSPRANWTLERMHRFANNYLSNVPPTLAGGKTLMDVVDGDLGHRPEHPAVYIEELQRHRPFLEELVASKMVSAEGEGLDRRYGVDVEDTRFQSPATS